MTDGKPIHDYCRFCWKRKNEIGNALKNIEPDRNPARIYYPISYEKPEFKGGVFNCPNK